MSTIRLGARIDGRGGWLVACACFAAPLGALAPPALVAQETTVLACDEADQNPWVAQNRTRWVDENDLVAFATASAGEPSTCEWEIRLWQGSEYRTLTMGFDGGLEFTLETMPPGIRIVHLRASGGFPDPDAAVGALRALTERRGLDIDWSSPDADVWDGLDVQQFWDPEPGLNASATIGRRGDTIVMLRWSIAP